MSKHFVSRKTTIIKKFDLVKHPVHGVGEVLEEWGTWLVCRNCFKPMPKTIRGVQRTGPVKRARHPISGAATVCCSDGLLMVSGYNIFDIRFFKDGKTRSINACWLTLVDEAGGNRKAA